MTFSFAESLSKDRLPYLRVSLPEMPADDQIAPTKAQLQKRLDRAAGIGLSRAANPSRAAGPSRNPWAIPCEHIAAHTATRELTWAEHLEEFKYEELLQKMDSVEHPMFDPQLP